MDDKQLQLEFILFLGLKLNAKDEKDLKNKVKNLKEEELKKYQNEFIEFKKKQINKHAHGAKLLYFKRLKNICEDNEELKYFKIGGKVGCGCVKKAQEGTKVSDKKSSVVDKFKKNREQTYDPKTRKMRPATEEEIALREKNRDDASKGKGEGSYIQPSAKYSKKIPSKCGGSKMKLIKKGDKVCPKCGKVHSAGMGCAVAKFKIHRLGGSLNGIPFIRKD